jgi:hypothetical protein
MKHLTPRLLSAAVVAAALMTGGCRRDSAEAYVDRLPDLPPDLAASLDPATLATRVPASFPSPEKLPTAVKPCCDITNTKSLRVTLRHTKCGPLRDFIVAPLGDSVLFRSNPGTTQIHRLRALGATVFDQTVCFTSDGPWNATLVERRNCAGYAPVQTLTINAFGEIVTFMWNGGVEGHPAQVGLVSCRLDSDTQIECPGLSECQCLSSTCSPPDPCACNLQW